MYLYLIQTDEELLNNQKISISCEAACETN